MAQFTLPKNSKVTEGKTWAYPSGAHDVREYKIYRWNPDDGKNPRMDTYYVTVAIAARWFSTRSSGSRTTSTPR